MASAKASEARSAGITASEQEVQKTILKYPFLARNGQFVGMEEYKRIIDAVFRMVGRNALEGRWSFQMVEEYDAIYWSVVRAFADDLRGELMGGRHHVLESEMKEDRRTHGGRFHEQRPTDVPN